MSAAERMRRLRARRKAAGLKPVVAWVPRTSEESLPIYSSHRLIEARSLAMHALIARKLSRNPALLELARKNIDRWRLRFTDHVPLWLEEWSELLKQPWERVAALIVEPSENASRLRQSTPFTGILSNAERWKIYDAFRA